MSKPLGLEFSIVREGAYRGNPTLRVHHPSPAEDRIWEAVEAAIEEGWTPQQFRVEAAECWFEYKRREAEDARKELL